MNVMRKEDVNLLIDTLIRSGGGYNPYGKMSEILKVLTKTEDIRLFRNTLLLWLDSMNILSVDFHFQPPRYKINRPVWVPITIGYQYILMGALTLKQIDCINLHPFVNMKSNQVSYKNLNIELPDTYYTENIQEVEDLGFKINYTPIFADIENDDDMNTLKGMLTGGNLEINEIEGLTGVSFVKNDQMETVNIENQDNIQMFDWITRSFRKCTLRKELDDSEGLKLIYVEKKYSETHREKYVILLKREQDGKWKYIYFDPTKIDERWARYYYMAQLTHYDLHRDLDDIKLVSLLYNIMNLKPNGLIEIDKHQDLNSKNVLKIPTEILKQLIHYDKRKGLLAVPVKIPLPKIFMNYLFSCSGLVPKIFKNNFSRNPNYIIKVLYSGKISINGQEIPYGDEFFYMAEDMYLFNCVPHELAQVIERKLGLKFYKRTFLETIN